MNKTKKVALHKQQKLDKKMRAKKREQQKAAK